MSSQPTAARAENVIQGEKVPSLDDIAAQHIALAPWVNRTPVFDQHGGGSSSSSSRSTLNFKFELLQASGSFKVRHAFCHLLALSEAQRNAGVTCVSGGNHAAAVAYAASRLGIDAKVVVLRSANPAQIALCRRYGANVVVADDDTHAFVLVRTIEADEGRYFVHPFNGYRTVLGSATLGYEWVTQVPDLEAVIVPVGGGGLAAGIGAALRLANPRCRVFGVEPEGADAMSRSFAADRPIRTTTRHTIADSLIAPHIEEYSFALCRRHLERIVTVSDDALRQAMLTMYEQLKLAVEPACAAPLAAFAGPLQETLAGKRVGILLSGSNLDLASFEAHLNYARRQRDEQG